MRGGKILLSRKCHRWQFSACALHAGKLRLHTDSEYVILVAFPLQQWLHECALLLRCTYIACLIFTCCEVCRTLRHIRTVVTEVYNSIYSHLDRMSNFKLL